MMKLKFSTRQLLIVTTVFAVVTGIAIRLNLLASDWRIIGTLATVYLVYLIVVGTFIGPRYYREFVELQKNRRRQKVTRAELEHEVQSKQQLRENEKNKAK